jgi:DHA1 family solute carrier family 18 vesicular amine transporter 1/2
MFYSYNEIKRKSLLTIVCFNKGPALSGFIVNSIGFEWMLIIIAFVCMLYSPLMFFLKNPPGKEENLVTIISFTLN